MEKKTWISRVLGCLAGMSRTLGGVSDTSVAAEKPKLAAEEGAGLAAITAENLERALEFLWESREWTLASAAEVCVFVDALATKVSAGLLRSGQSLYRTWETKFRQTAVVKIEEEYQRFAEWLHGAFANGKDSVETAALIEKRLDAEIHPFADGCGRTAKILAAFVLLRAGLNPPAYRSRAEYYATITRSDAEWLSYYRSLLE